MQETPGVLEAFRAHFAHHNRDVLLYTAFALAAALLLWVAAYIFIYWITLLLVTASQGVDARVPGCFLPVFGICAFLLCLLALLARKIWPGFVPRDTKSPFEVCVDILMVIPRVTLAVWGNFSARQSLSEFELEEAWVLLQTIGRKGKLSIQSLPLEIPDPGLRTKVVLALQLTGLIEFRKEGAESWLALQGAKARSLCQSTIRITAGR
jgi:hypothetical protein